MVSLKDKYYNKRQFKLEKLYADYSSGKISARKYYAVLQKHTAALGIDIYKYPNTALYLAALSKGKELNYKAISRQLQTFLAYLKEHIPYGAYKALLDSTSGFSETDKLYVYLADTAKKFNIDLETGFSALDEYFKYIDLGRRLNPLELVSEEQRLNDEINSRFSDYKAQKEAVFLISFQKHLRNFLSGKITAADYEYYKNNMELYKKLYVKYVDNKVLSLLDDYISQAGKFYEVNLDRNKYFANSLGVSSPSVFAVDAINSLQLQSTDVSHIIGSMRGKQVDIVITGGFHTQGVSKILKDNNVSYVVITPNVSDGVKEAEETYYRIAREQSKIAFQALANMAASMSLSDQIKVWFLADPQKAKEIYKDYIEEDGDRVFIKAGNVRLDIQSIPETQTSQAARRLMAEAAKILESDDKGDIIAAVAEKLKSGVSERFTGEITEETVVKINLDDARKALIDGDAEKLENIIKNADYKDKPLLEKFLASLKLAKDLLVKAADAAKINSPIELAKGFISEMEISENADDITESVTENSEAAPNTLSQINSLEQELIDLGIENIPDIAIRAVSQRYYDKDSENRYGRNPQAFNFNRVINMVGISGRLFAEESLKMETVAGENKSLDDIRVSDLSPSRLYPDADYKKLFMILLRNTALHALIAHGYDAQRQEEVNLEQTPVFIAFRGEDANNTNEITLNAYGNSLKVKENRKSRDILIFSPETALKRFYYSWYSKTGGILAAEELFSVTLTQNELDAILSEFSREDIENQVCLYAYKKFLERLVKITRENIESKSTKLDPSKSDERPQSEDKNSGILKGAAKAIIALIFSVSLFFQPSAAQAQPLNTRINAPQTQEISVLQIDEIKKVTQLDALQELKPTGVLDAKEKKKKGAFELIEEKLKPKRSVFFEAFDAVFGVFIVSAFLSNPQFAFAALAFMVGYAILSVLIKVIFDGLFQNGSDKKKAVKKEETEKSENSVSDFYAAVLDKEHSRIANRIKSGQLDVGEDDLEYVEMFSDEMLVHLTRNFGFYGMSNNTMADSIKITRDNQDIIEAAFEKLEAVGIKFKLRASVLLFALPENISSVSSCFATGKVAVIPYIPNLTKEETINYVAQRLAHENTHVDNYYADAQMGVFEHEELAYSNEELATAAFGLQPSKNSAILSYDRLSEVSKAFGILKNNEDNLKNIKGVSDNPRFNYLKADTRTADGYLLCIITVYDENNPQQEFKAHVYSDGTLKIYDENGILFDTENKGAAAAEAALEAESSKAAKKEKPAKISAAQEAAKAANPASVVKTIRQISDRAGKMISSKERLAAEIENGGFILSDNLILSEDETFVGALLKQGFNAAVVRELAKKPKASDGWKKIAVSGDIKIYFNENGFMKVIAFYCANGKLNIEAAKESFKEVIGDGIKTDAFKGIKNVAMANEFTTYSLVDAIKNNFTDSVNTPVKERVLNLHEAETITSLQIKRGFETDGIYVFVLNERQAQTHKSTIAKLRGRGVKFVIAAENYDIKLDGLRFDAKDKTQEEVKEVLEKLKRRKNAAFASGLDARITIALSNGVLDAFALEDVDIWKKYGILPIVSYNSTYKYFGKSEIEFDAKALKSDVIKELGNDNAAALSASDETDAFIGSLFNGDTITIKDALKEKRTAKQHYDKGLKAALESKFNYTAQNSEYFFSLMTSDKTNTPVGAIKAEIEEGVKFASLSKDSQAYLNYLTQKERYYEAVGFIRGVVMNSAREEIFSAFGDKNIDKIKMQFADGGKIQKAFLTLAVKLKMRGMKNGKTIKDFMQEDYNADYEMNAADFFNFIAAQVGENIDDLLNENEYSIKRLDSEEKEAQAYKLFNQFCILVQDRFKKITANREIKTSILAVRSILSAA
ncbi:MAG: hypothetical protein LBO62_05635 [Endomicrobium sp.]|jgi:hypothetical protein|nr:hypothetical protein [Endomicrobium sp.]